MRKKEHPFKRLRFFVLTGLIVTALLVLLVSNIGKSRDFGTLQKLLVEVVAPVQHGLRLSQRGIGGIWERYISLVNTREENELLRKELKRLQAENSQYREAVVANIRYKKLLDFKEATPLPLLSALVVGYDPSVWFKTVMINHGSNDGLQKGMAVVCADGIAGQIVGVSLHYAKVLLITDGNSAVDGAVQRSRVRGVLKGASGRTCYLDYVDRRADVVAGDVVISSGLGGVFPKGLPLGRVTKVDRSRPGLFQEIEVSPAVDFSNIEEVFVVLLKDSLTE
jgi:rod shape-determining protein MreC